MVLKWQDKRDVYMVITLHKSGSEKTTNKRGKEKDKSTVNSGYGL